MARYVILRHETPPVYARETHWDFMLEMDDALMTWAIVREPILGATIEAEKLADHRKNYLDYEGPVSGDRGSVTQWTSGIYTMLRHSADEILVHLDTGRIAGTVRLARTDDPHWLVTFSAANAAV